MAAIHQLFEQIESQVQEGLAREKKATESRKAAQKAKREARERTLRPLKNLCRAISHVARREEGKQRARILGALYQDFHDREVAIRATLREKEAKEQERDALLQNEEEGPPEAKRLLGKAQQMLQAGSYKAAQALVQEAKEAQSRFEESIDSRTEKLESLQEEINLVEDMEQNLIDELGFCEQQKVRLTPMGSVRRNQESLATRAVVDSLAEFGERVRA